MADQEEKRIIVKVAYNYFQSGNWDRALDEYKKLIAIDPMDFLVHNMMAEIHTRRGDKTEAVREYLHAASLLRATNNMEKALLAYGRVLKLDPQHQEAREKTEEIVRTRLVEADEYLRRGSLIHAREICDRLDERVPEHPLVLEKIAEIERRQKEQPTPPIERAIRSTQPAAPAREAVPSGFEEPVKRDQLVKNLFDLAQHNESKQNWDEAVEAYITILRFQPNDEKARTKLHDLYRKITRGDKAAEVWARINAEDKKRLEQAKRVARETKPAAPAAGQQPPAAPEEDGVKGPKLDTLRQQAEEKLRRAVEDRRVRDQSRNENTVEEVPAPSAEAAASTSSQVEQEINVLLTQANIYVHQHLLAEAMRLCQRILELDPQNRNVRGLLQQIFEKKKL
jgi:tetratricopeptide (TPR) repeat protein